MMPTTRRNALLAATLLLAAPAFAGFGVNGSGRLVTEDRAVSGFTGLSLSLPATVDVAQGASEKLTVTADDNVMAEIETVVERGVLKLRFRKNFTSHNKVTIRIAVAVKALDSIAVSGSGDVSAPALTATKLAIHIAGSGNTRVGGRADSLEVNISGSGDVDAARLDTKSTAVSIAGSGDAIVWARQALRARVAGSGDIRYLGDPAITKSIAGSGSVRRAGVAPS
jgi:hypothetical protein